MKYSQRRQVLFFTVCVLSIIVLRSLWSGWSSSSNINNNVASSDAVSTPSWQRSPLWAEDQRPQVNPHRFNLMLNAPDTCADGERVDLVVLISSATTHSAQRDAIRQTWADRQALQPYHVKVLFLLGQGSERQSLIAEESRMEGDIIQEDFTDSYQNLTLKTVMGLKWSSIFCPQAKFVMKTDDDIFVNVPLLHNAISTENTFARQISGCIKNAPHPAFQPIPHFDNKVELENLPPAHPAFTAGAGYIIAGSLVSDLYLASLNTRLFPVEDVFTTAHCAKRIGAHPPRHDSRFSCGEMVQRACVMKTKFTGHNVTPDLQAQIWEKLQEEKCG